MTLPSRIAPHDLSAEAALLGGALLDTSTASLVASVQPACFYTESHRAIARAIGRLVRDGQPVDTLTLLESLRTAGELEVAGGPAAVAGLEADASIRANAPAYLAIVREKAARRVLIQTGTSIVSEAFDDAGRDSGALVSDALSRLIAVQGGGAELLEPADLFKPITAAQGRAIPTDFSVIDDNADGLNRGHLFVVAGRPGMGKTALACQLAHRLVTVEKVPTLFLSLEMPQHEIAARILSVETGVNSRLIRTATEPYPDVIRAAREKLRACPIIVQARQGVRALDDVLALIRSAVVTKGAKVVILDHMGKVTGHIRDNRYLETSEVAEELKAVAMQLDVPLVVLCQLNRAVENRNVTKPKPSDLRDSGRIEEESDGILFLWSDDERLDGDPLLVTFTLAKNRGGPTGDKAYWFDKSPGRFREASSRGR